MFEALRPRAHLVSYDLKNLVEARIAKNIPCVVVQVRQSELMPGLLEALLHGQQDTQSRTCDVLQIGKIHDPGLGDPFKEPGGLLHLSGIERACQANPLVLVQADLQHSHLVLPGRAITPGLAQARGGKANQGLVEHKPLGEGPDRGRTPSVPWAIPEGSLKRAS